MSKQENATTELLKYLPESNENSENEGEKPYGDEHLAQLKRTCENFLKKQALEVGQIVKWKDNLKNRKLPHKNQPAIVIFVLDEPIISTDDEPGSPYFLEALDIVLGIITDDGTFLTFYYDSRRFETYLSH
ncbi:hypothetical protein TUMEXPCC7403_11490 [Tumidithrix helvetica PCC 7403]|uniref:hypothetical protein n=1 Tax=Tumidithrix helvetica TaxID=3457545 RepID=UPI003C92BAAC